MDREPTPVSKASKRIVAVHEAALHALIFQKGARAIMSALDQIIQYRNLYGSVPIKVFLTIAAFNFVHPLKLARQVEQAGLCKPGMPTRLQALVNDNGFTWGQLTNEALKDAP